MRNYLHFLFLFFNWGFVYVYLKPLCSNQLFDDDADRRVKALPLNVALIVAERDSNGWGRG